MLRQTVTLATAILLGSKLQKVWWSTSLTVSCFLILHVGLLIHYEFKQKYKGPCNISMISAYIHCAQSGTSTWLLRSLGLRASRSHSRSFCSLGLCTLHSHSWLLRSLGLRTLHSHQRWRFARRSTIIIINKKFAPVRNRTCTQSLHQIWSPLP